MGARVVGVKSAFLDKGARMNRSGKRRVKKSDAGAELESLVV